MMKQEEKNVNKKNKREEIKGIEQKWGEKTKQKGAQIRMRAQWNRKMKSKEKR